MRSLILAILRLSAFAAVQGRFAVRDMKQTVAVGRRRLMTFSEYPPLGRFAVRDMKQTVAVGR